MMDPVENLSMLVKPKDCTWAKRSLRTFFARPEDAIAAYRPDMNPEKRETAEQISRISPNFMMAGMERPDTP